MNPRWREWVPVGATAVILLASCATAQPAASPTTVVDTPTATLTVYASTPTSTRPVLTNTPTSTLAAPTPTPTPTEAPVPIALVEEQMAAELVSELAPLDVAESHIDSALFDAMNPGQRLLVPKGLTCQGYTNLTYEGQPVAVMNVNVPLYRPRPLSDPAINRLETDNLITWEDNEGNLLYHVPMAAANEGLAPVVFVNEKNQLQFGWVDGAGKLDPDSIVDYWQAMPAGAIRAVMAKYVPDNTVYVTFWEKDSNELKEERIKVVELPASPTATPEVARPEAIDIVGLSKTWNDRAGRWEYIDPDNKSVAFWNVQERKMEITTTVLTEKHLGLFQRVKPEEAQRLWDNNHSSYDNLKFVFPLDLSSVEGKKFKIEITKSGRGFDGFYAIFPAGARLVSPMKASAVPEWRGPVPTVLLKDIQFGSTLLLLVMGSPTIPFKERQIINAGKSSMEMQDPNVTIYTYIYNSSIGEAMQDVNYESLFYSPDGRILCF